MTNNKKTQSKPGSSYICYGSIMCGKCRETAAVIRPDTNLQEIFDNPMLAIDRLYCPKCRINVEPPPGC